jgi:hypothetical protein
MGQGQGSQVPWLEEGAEGDEQQDKSSGGVRVK